ncbi:alcohol dehydrogenase superfamily protein [Panaeolus papilionaceus]|nr:alcohol dehydrogenase superfamily protein [Panaeolus papilionaceus]
MVNRTQAPTTTKAYNLTTVGDYHSLKIVDAPIPALKSTQVLVKIHAVSLQFRDLLIARNAYAYGNATPENLVPLSDAAGEIIQLGDEVTGWAIGDRVCCNFLLDRIHGPVTPEIAKTALGFTEPGVLTQYRVFPAKSLVSIPEHLSYEEASTLPCSSLTAWSCIRGPQPVQPGHTVLVQGTGGVSIAALQFAVAFGATVIVTSSSDDKLEFAKKLGAKHVINYKKTPNWDEEVLKITNGAGVDHIVEVGGEDTLLKSLNAVKFGGTIHLVGIIASVDFDGPNPNVVRTLIFKEATIRGIHIGSLYEFQQMNNALAAYPEITRPVVDKMFEFEEAIQAMEHLESQRHIGKVVIRVAPRP